MLEAALARPIIAFRGVDKSFGRIAVLQDLNFQVSPGEHVCLIGPSGSGKSTILRVLMTLERIDQGEVVIDGDPLWSAGLRGSAMAPKSRVGTIRGKVGMVFQGFNLFPHMSALRNIAEAPIRVLKMPRDEAYSRAEELLKLVGLGDKRDNYPVQLSGGQQQRVAIARALAMRPKILLFDEVTSALDPETVGEVLAVIRQLAKEHSFTILMVTHHMELAREISDRICFLEGGNILEEGPPEKIFSAPENPRTSAFLQAVFDV